MLVFVKGLVNMSPQLVITHTNDVVSVAEFLYIIKKDRKYYNVAIVDEVHSAIAIPRFKVVFILSKEDLEELLALLGVQNEEKVKHNARSRNARATEVIK